MSKPTYAQLLALYEAEKSKTAPKEKSVPISSEIKIDVEKGIIHFARTDWKNANNHVSKAGNAYFLNIVNAAVIGSVDGGDAVITINVCRPNGWGKKAKK